MKINNQWIVYMDAEQKKISKIPMYLVDKEGNYITNPEWLSDQYNHLKEQHYELKRLAPNARYHAHRVAQLVERLSAQDEQIMGMEEKLKKQQVRIQELEQIVNNRSSIDTTEMVVLQVDSNRVGAYVPAATHIKIKEELKQLKERYNDK